MLIYNRFCWRAAVLFLLSAGWTSWSVSTVSAAATGSKPGIVDDIPYATDAAARAAWRPMGGSSEVSLATFDDGKALRFPCRFTGAAVERASWDRRVDLDMAGCRGIEFQLLCRDASPVSYFSIYLQSGAGWYHASFYPERSNGWNTINLDKSAFGIEGKPEGWGKIRTIRLSAWRGESRDTEMFIRGMRLTGLLGSDALIAILRCDSAAQRNPAETRSVTQFTETTAELLQLAAVDSAVLSDLDVSADQLRRAKVVILPHNPTLPDAAANLLRNYAATGGKLLICYAVPPQLRDVVSIRGSRHVKEPHAGYFAAVKPRAQALPGAPALVRQHSWNVDAAEPGDGAQVLADWLDDNGKPTGHAAIVGSTNALVFTHVLLPDDRENKSRLLMAMVGFLSPELWRSSAQQRMDRIAVGGLKNFAESIAAISKLAPNNPRVVTAVADARGSHSASERLFAAGNYPAASEAAISAGAQLMDAWCLAQSPSEPEFRAFWCHSAFGVEGMSWDEALGRLSSNGFTAILPNMLWGGAAYYPSKVLPVAPAVASRGDQIAQCVAAARKHGLQIHVWKVNWNLGHAAPREFVEKMRGAGRLQEDSRGKQEPWLCPSHPENRKLEVDSLVEVVRNYDVDGIHFDYIRYPDGDHCFCAGCKDRFQMATGTTVRQWPSDLKAAGPLREQWLDWRRGNINTVVKSFAKEARAIKPKLKISAAVFPRWATDRDSVGQDWKLWCEQGWVDFVCPMDYTQSARQFENMVARQVVWAGKTPVYPGIGESASSSRIAVDGVIEQIQITRRHNTGGFVIFNYGGAEANELVPKLGMGITARR